MIKKTENEKISLVLSKGLLKDIKSHSKKFNYNSEAEFMREALREKLYGKDIKEEIANDFLREIEKEKSYIFSEKKDLHEKLKAIANRF